MKGKYLTVDSCPILANVKENNSKTNVKSRFKKDGLPKNDSDYSIGIFPTFVHDTKRVDFFWGWPSHIINDCES